MLFERNLKTNMTKQVNLESFHFIGKWPRYPIKIRKKETPNITFLRILQMGHIQTPFHCKLGHFFAEITWLWKRQTTPPEMLTHTLKNGVNSAREKLKMSYPTNLSAHLQTPVNSAATSRNFFDCKHGFSTKTETCLQVYVCFMFHR